jgi:hypothetical protein
MSFPKSFTGWFLLITGMAMVIFAIVIPNSDYSLFLRGDNGKNLSWGPTLFRILTLFHGLVLVILAIFLKKFKLKETEKSRSSERSLITRNSLGFLLILSLIALILRSINLNSDLWVDEVLTLLDYVRQPIGHILTSFPNQNQHMFYSVLARISFNIFGESAWAVRLPSVLFGIGSIWAAFLLGKRLLGKNEAILVSILMTVSYHHIWFSQNARGYMGLLFFTLLVTFFWFEALEKNKWFWWLAYSASIILGMWIHMTMAFIVATHGIVYLLLLLFPKYGDDKSGKDFSPERRAGIKPIVAWILSVTVTLQLYALALPEFLSVGLHEESKNSLWTNPLWVIRETFQNLSIGFAGIAVVVVGGAFVAFGWLSIFKKNRRAAVLMIVPPILAGTFMLVLGHNLFPRFFFFAMGFGLLIVIHGALEIPEFILNNTGFLKKNRFIRNYAGFCLGLLMIVASLVTVPRNYSLPKQDFTGAKHFVESNKPPGEKVVAVSIAGMMYGRYFAPDWAVADTEIDLKRIEENNQNLWLVYTLSPEIKAFHPQMWQMIEKDYKVVKIFPGTLNGGEIFVCRKRN